jgi:hypothetical protein
MGDDGREVGKRINPDIDGAGNEGGDVVISVTVSKRDDKDMNVEPVEEDAERLDGVGGAAEVQSEGATAESRRGLAVRPA